VSLRIGAKALAHMHTELGLAYPEEGCGVLLGRDVDAAREVLRAVALVNTLDDAKHRRYTISPDQFLAAERSAREAGLDVVGFFHSHPDHPARPSAFDLEHAWPWYSYVIVSVTHGRAADTTSWRLRDDRAAFEPETIETLREPEALARDGA
jgi:proteasome lid subunit RPN8/RPN11